MNEYGSQHNGRSCHHLTIDGENICGAPSRNMLWVCNEILYDGINWFERFLDFTCPISDMHSFGFCKRCIKKAEHDFTKQP